MPKNNSKNEMKFLKILFNLTLLVFFITAPPAEARWTQYEDVPIEIKISNSTININGDGTYEIESEFQAKVLKEHGRSVFSQYSLIYNGDGVDLTI